jgi:hypothetical protein
MLRSIKQDIEGKPRNLAVRRAFNTFKNEGEEVQTMLDALGTLNDANMLKTRYSIEMSKFFGKASEPRMVWQLGLLYYSLVNVDIWYKLIQIPPGMFDRPITPFEIYDTLENWNNDDVKVFHRELFDGSIRTMSALIEFLDPSGDLANMQLTLDDFEFQFPHLRKCTRYKQVDFNDLVVNDGKLDGTGGVLDASYRGSDHLVSIHEFRFGSMNLGMSLYEAPGDGTKFMIKEIPKDSHEADIMKKFAPFNESCNVIGARLFEVNSHKSRVVMQPLSGDLQGLHAKSEKVARKVCFEIAKSYRCMIERHGLYYNDIKLENVMYACDTETNVIKLFAGDFGGFAEQYHETAAAHFTLLPYNHFFIYDIQERGPAVAYPIDELTVVLSRYNYPIRDVEDVNEDDLFVAVPNGKEKPVLLRVEDGMYEKYLELVQPDKQMVKNKKTPAKKAAVHKPPACSTLNKKKGRPLCEDAENRNRCRWIKGTGCRKK